MAADRSQRGTGMKRKHIGSNFDDFLEENGVLEECRVAAIKFKIARELQKAMRARKLTRADVAKRLKTSRASIDRLLDPDNTSITLNTIAKVAQLLGKRIEFRTSLGLTRIAALAKVPAGIRHQTSISVSSSTPKCSATRLRTSSISFSTSVDLASGATTMKFAFRSLTSAPPIALAFQARLLDQHAGADAAGVFENAAGRFVAERLSGPFDDPLRLHPLRQFLRIVFLQLELASQNRQFVEAALPIGEHKVFALALQDFAGAAHHRGSGSPLADVAAAAAGVAVQRTADRAGDADERFQPGQPFAHDRGHDMTQLRPAADRDGAAVDADLGKRWHGEPHDQPLDAVVAHQQIRAAAEQANLHARIMTAATPAPPILPPNSARRKTRPARRVGTTCAAPVGSASRTIFSKPPNKDFIDLVTFRRPPRH